MSIVGARPNFVKLAPIHKAISTFADHVIIHTGQHYDFKLSEVFFKDFSLPQPDFNLEVGSGTPGFQIGEMIKRIEKVLLGSDFDLAIVYGDTNSTLSGALSAVRCEIRVAHVEAGLRSFDRHMPEEINRILTDHMSDYLFAPTQTAVENLKSENVFGNIIYTGDLSVELIRDAIQYSSKSTILDQLRLAPKSYVLLTMHRAENTESADNLISVITAIEILSEVKIVFPIHPRTEKVLREKKLYSRLKRCKNLKLIEPLGYIDFIKLLHNANKVITDSGGVQKESYLLEVPCITIRKNTEWIETVDMGWNVLAGTDVDNIVEAVRKWMPPPLPSQPSARVDQVKSIFGDGQTSAAITNAIRSLLMQAS